MSACIGMSWRDLYFYLYWLFRCASVTDIMLAMILACLLLMLAKYTPLELPDIFAV